MTADYLSGTLAVILSLAFSYIPKLNTWFAALEPEIKRLIMLGLLALIAGVSYGLACWGVLADLTGIELTCDKTGLFELLRVFVMAIIANQGIYSLSPQTEAVREVKAFG
jgi:hypothetical protein